MRIGKRTRIWNPSNVYGCDIGDDCIISAFAEIQTDVTIGHRCKIECGAFIPSGVCIDDGVFIGPNVVFTNDKFPSAVNKDGTLQTSDDWKCLKTYVRKGVSIGANSTILPGIEIGEYAMIGAGSVVTKNVSPYSVMVGNPAQKIKVRKI